MKIDNSQHITYTKYWRIDSRAGAKFEFVRSLKVATKVVNNNVLSKFGVRIIKSDDHKRVEQISFPSRHTVEYRNDQLSVFLADFFNSCELPINIGETQKYIAEFDGLFKEQPITNLNGGMGYNNALISFILVKLLQPKKLIESGVWRGFSTYLLHNATPDDAQFYCYDINFSLLEYKSTKASYYNCDISQNEGVDHRGVTLAFIDDHVSHYDRLHFCVDNDITVAIFDDDVSLMSLHSDGWPPIPTANMVFNYQDIPKQFDWHVNGEYASANIEGLDVGPILEKYKYFRYPELFDFTGYRNTSATSFVVKI